MFTGMQVLNPDRSRFHGGGIVPRIEAEPTAADLAEGRDTELLRTIQFLQTGQEPPRLGHATFSRDFRECGC